MSTLIQLILADVVLIALAPDAYGQQNVTPIEIAQLPRFCWAQYVPGTTGEGYHISGCGPAANHFCPALIYMIRARGHVNKSTSLGLLGSADADVRYTERAIADYPKCSIRDDVANARAEVNRLMTMYGYNRPKAK
jgi:hypothetical protein